MMGKLKIAVLLTCYNRRDKTLACLRALFHASLPDGYSLSVFLVDDGSQDGTTEAVTSHFPSVNVIKGTGSLYWNRGMILAWENAAANDYDFYLWLNDDTLIKTDALEIILANSASQKNSSIICGICESAETGEVTYGGLDLSLRQIIIPNEQPTSCDYFNGNIVLVPRLVFDKLGTLDPVFTHALGDYDYGLRAKKLGISSWVTDGAIAYCERNQLPHWCNPDTSFKKRLNFFYTPLGASPKEYFIYAKRHFGPAIAIKRFLALHLRLLFPKAWVK